MHLYLKNIGPIREGKIELADKVVVVGRNGSGKTMISSALILLMHIDLEANVLDLYRHTFGFKSVLSRGEKEGLMSLEGVATIKLKENGLDYEIYDTSPLKEWRPLVDLPTHRRPAKPKGFDVLNTMLYGKPFPDIYPWSYTKYINVDEIIEDEETSFGILQLRMIRQVLNSNARTIVIEDPELGLHVDAVIELARELSKLRGKKLFITTHDEWFPMFIAKFSKIYNYSAKVYEIVDGMVEEREINEEGYVDTFKTIFPPQDEALDELFEEGELESEAS